MAAAAEHIQNYLKAGRRVRLNYSDKELEAIKKPNVDEFYRKPLADMAPAREAALANLPVTLEKLAVETAAIKA